ncbi:MAG TPA: dihydrodipicolinate synthase family protein [Chloroflexota bacterium]
MDGSDLRGIIPALITPLDAGAEPDQASIHNLIDFQITAGVRAVFVLGSTGEGPLLTTDQKLRVIRATVEAAGGRVPVLAAISHSSPGESVTFGRLAQAAGANALVTTSPFYFLHSQAELVAYFRYLKQALELPIATYDVPSAVKVKLSASTVRQLADERLVIGVKDSSGDLAGFREMVLATAHLSDFRALTGSEHYVDAALQVGGHGAVLGLASVVPGLYVDIFQAASRGDWARAAELQKRAIAVLHMISVGQSGGSVTASAIGSFKVALREMGVIRSAAVSVPLQALNPSEEEAVRSILRIEGVAQPAAPLPTH